MSEQKVCKATFIVSSIAGLVLLAGCAAIETDSPYNAGVEAWKKKDYQEAADQWSKAVLTGNPDAMNNLGYLYFYGLGMKPRKADAVGLWRAAAFSGESESQMHLGNAYETGDGVQRNLVDAYVWYACSAFSAGARKGAGTSGVEAQIETSAAKSVDRLAVELSAEELAQARQLADDCVSRYGVPPP